MKRLVYPQILDWKHSSTRKPLVLNGARQEGKTWPILTFVQGFASL